MKKVIHFSDVHIGFEDMHKRFYEVISNLATLKQPAGDYVVVITGDIVDKASDENYLMGRKYLDVLSNYGYKVLVVPGNHDYGSGDSADEKWVKEFKKQFFDNVNITYPKLDVIDEVAFIGLDSMEAELHWWDKGGGDGELGKEQLGKLDAMLRSDKVKDCLKVVYLHHHPWDPIPRHKLKDSDKFCDVLKNHKVDALLFGHLHHGKKWNGLCNIPRVYDAGTTTMKEGRPGFHRVMHLNRNAVKDYDADLHGEYANISKLSLSQALLDLLSRI